MSLSLSFFSYEMVMLIKPALLCGLDEISNIKPCSPLLSTWLELKKSGPQLSLTAISFLVLVWIRSHAVHITMFCCPECGKANTAWCLLLMEGKRTTYPWEGTSFPFWQYGQIERKAQGRRVRAETDRPHRLAWIPQEWFIRQNPSLNQPSKGIFGEEGQHDLVWKIGAVYRETVYIYEMCLVPRLPGIYLGKKWFYRNVPGPWSEEIWLYLLALILSMEDVALGTILLA